MSDGTKIEWTDATWNVVNGCTVVSPGCANCYAMRQAHRFPVRQGLTRPTPSGMTWTGEVRFNEAVLTQPLKWKRPRRIFVCAHGDLFHPSVPDEWIDRVFAVMALATQHTFQVLTKRPERMRDYLSNPDLEARLDGEMDALIGERVDPLNRRSDDLRATAPCLAESWPLPNVWLGTSVEDQQRADERIPILLDTPAAVRWLSMEPLLGPVDLSEWFVCPNSLDQAPIMDPTTGVYECCSRCDYTGIAGFSGTPIPDWIVLGGESGPGARPMHPDWAREVRDQCAAAVVPFLFKQWGNYLPAGQVAAQTGLWQPSCGSSLLTTKRNAGRLLDGVQHDGYPA